MGALPECVFPLEEAIPANYFSPFRLPSTGKRCWKVTKRNAYNELTKSCEKFFCEMEIQKFKVNFGPGENFEPGKIVNCTYVGRKPQTFFTFAISSFYRQDISCPVSFQLNDFIQHSVPAAHILKFHISFLKKILTQRHIKLFAGICTRPAWRFTRTRAQWYFRSNFWLYLHSLFVKSIVLIFLSYFRFNGFNDFSKLSSHTPKSKGRICQTSPCRPKTYTSGCIGSWRKVLVFSKCTKDRVRNF